MDTSTRWMGAEFEPWAMGEPGEIVCELDREKRRERKETRPRAVRRRVRKRLFLLLGEVLGCGIIAEAEMGEGLGGFAGGVAAELVDGRQWRGSRACCFRSLLNWRSVVWIMRMGVSWTC